MAHRVNGMMKRLAGSVGLGMLIAAGPGSATASAGEEPAAREVQGTISSPARQPASIEVSALLEASREAVRADLGERLARELAESLAAGRAAVEAAPLVSAVN